MTVEAVNQFLEKVSEDEKLQEELAKALEVENDREAATELAGKYGYEFNSDELWQEVQKRQTDLQQRQEAGELSDEELEAVAGGESAVATALVSAGIAIGGALAKNPPKIKW